MSKLAERVKSGGRRQSSGDEMDEDRLIRRMNSAANHLTKLSNVAPKLDADDYTAIRDKLMVAVEEFSSAYKSAKHTPAKGS